MKNNLSNDLDFFKMIKSLSTGPCVGCVFNKLGECAIFEVYTHFNNLDFFPKKIDKCNIKITHKDFVNFIWDDYFARSCCSDKSTTYLSLLLDDISNFKNSIKEEN